MKIFHSFFSSLLQRRNKETLKCSGLTFQNFFSKSIPCVYINENLDEAKIGKQYKQFILGQLKIYNIKYMNLFYAQTCMIDGMTESEMNVHYPLFKI